MKRIFVLLVLVAMPQGAWALKNPTSDEIDAIKFLVKEAKKPSEAFGRMAEIEEKIGLRPKGGGDKLSPPEPVSSQLGKADALYVYYLRDVDAYNKKHEAAIKRLTALSGDEREEYAAVLRQYYADQKRSAGLYEKAMQATMTAYGIPVPKSGQVVNGAPKPRSAAFLPSHVGTEAAWLPTYAPKMKKKTYGETDSRARVTIGPDAFEYPGRLALTLYHESLHYQELLGAKRSDFWNEPEREVRARVQCEAELERIFEVTTDDFNRHRQDLVEYRRLSASWAQVKRVGLDPFNLAHRTAFPGAKLNDPFGESGAGPLPETVEIARRAKDIETEIQAFAGLRHMSWLQSLAERACAHQGHVLEFITQRDLDELHYQPRAYYEGSMSSTMSEMPCHQGLFQRMLRFLRGGGPLTLDWIESYSMDAYVKSPEYRQAPIAPPEYVEPPVVFVPPEPPRLIMPPPMLSPLEDIALVDLALKACSEGVTAEDLKKFAWFPRPEVEIGGPGYSGRLGAGCALEVYKYFARVNKDAGKLDADAVNSQAGRGGSGGDEEGRPRGSPRREWSQPPNPSLKPPKFR